MWLKKFLMAMSGFSKHDISAGFRTKNIKKQGNDW